jgi:CheY-like chemotaxis protein
MPDVLLAEDYVDAAEMYAEFLRFHGFDVVVVHDGLAALTAAHERQFDLIVLDVGMPGMNGIEVVRTLRAEGARVPIVALTAHAFPQERAGIIEAGFDLLITKPVVPRQLLATLSTLLPLKDAST